MATLEQLRTRLASWSDLRSIVKTMKALSAASIRQYEQAALALEEYDHTVGLALHAVLERIGPPAVPVSTGAGPTVVAVLGSNHGLCGRLNEEVVELATTHCKSLLAAGRALRTIAVGARVVPLLSRSGFDTDTTLDAPGSAARINALVQDIMLAADTWLGPDALASMSVVYARRTGTALYRPVVRPVLPIALAAIDASASRWPGRAPPMLTMTAVELLHSLQQQQLFVAVFRACAESQASEHGSRLVAMTAAQRNVETRIGDATFELRRVRQDAITAELLDVVAGYEAFGSQGSMM